MQTIAPDFYVPFDGSSQAHNQERPGDGLFDALLRDEEARYEREPQATREHAEATRPARDDLGRDDLARDDLARDERLQDEPLRDQRAERPEVSPNDQDVVRETQASQGDDSRELGHDDQSGAVQETDAVSETAAAEDSGTAIPQSDKPAPSITLTGFTTGAGNATVTLDLGTVGDTTGLNSGLASIQQAQAAIAAVHVGPDTKAPEPVTAAIGKTAAVASSTAATALATTAQATAAAPGPSTRKTAAPPANGASATQSVADQATTAATTKASDPATFANRQSPTKSPEVPVENGIRPSSRPAGSALGGDLGAAMPVADSLRSRPSAALGGGAATAAMAQPGKAEVTAKTQPSPTGPQSGLQESGNKPVQQPGKTPAATIAATPDKAAGASLATAPTGGDAAAPSASGSGPATTVVGNGAVSGGGVQNSSFAEVVANTRPGPSASPAEQIAVQVRTAQVAGKEQINIKLHPAELGRIEVKLENGSDGTLKAVISAERPDTLDLLQRDARGLERALQDAGVKTDSGSLSFNLRRQGQEQQADGDGAPGRAGSGDITLAADSGDPVASEFQQPQSSHDGALDIRV